MVWIKTGLYRIYIFKMAARNLFLYLYQVCQFVDCGSPPELENGEVELVDGRTTYGAEMRYSCGPDYNLSGDTTRRSNFIKYFFYSQGL